LIKPSVEVFINSFDVASDPYCIAIQNMLGRLDISTNTEGFSLNIAMHMISKTGVARTNAI